MCSAAPQVTSGMKIDSGHCTANKNTNLWSLSFCSLSHGGHQRVYTASFKQITTWITYCIALIKSWNVSKLASILLDMYSSQWNLDIGSNGALQKCCLLLDGQGSRMYLVGHRMIFQDALTTFLQHERRSRRVVDMHDWRSESRGRDNPNSRAEAIDSHELGNGRR